MSFLSSLWSDFSTKLASKQQENPVLLSILRQLKPVELTDTKIVLGCDNQATQSYLAKRANEIELELAHHLSKKLEVEFVIVEKKVNDKSSPLLSYQPPPDDLYVKAGLNKKYTFDNFAVSSTNQVAYAASQAVVNNPGSAYNPLFLHGGVGVGKTHLAQSVAKKILEADNNKRAYFCPGDNFTNELIESIREKSTMRFRKKYRSLDLLIVDDIQFIAGKEHVQEEFFHTFNSIVSSGGQIILASDRPLIEIKNLEDRLRSRFSGGLIVDIQPPDFELRTAIILIKAKEKNINIDIEAAKIIAERIEDSRSLEGTLLSIYAQILGKKEIIDLEVVDYYFSTKTENSQMRKKINPASIIKVVCNYYNIRPTQLKDQSRAESIVLPRQITMYLLRKELGLKLMETAEVLRRKDHTTVLHAEKKIAGLIMKDPAIKKDIDIITQNINQST